MANLLSNIATTSIQLGSVASTFSTISQLLTGGGPITLGSFEFKSFEIPQSISYGPRVQTTTHLLPGGAKWLDSMAADYRDISWQGIFLSSDAQSRAATLQALVSKRQALPLTFGHNYFEVVVTDLQIQLRQPGRIEYQITCEVQTNNATSASSTSPLSAIESDIGSALGITNLPSVLGSVGSALDDAQTIVGGISTLTGASSAVQSLVGTLTSIQTTIGSVTSTANSTLGTLTSLGSSISGADAAINQINSVASNTGILATAGQVGSFVSRAANNLTGGIL